MARAAMDVIDAMYRGSILSADQFFLNIQEIIAKYFDGQFAKFSRALSLGGSNPKNWIVRKSSPTWASVADLSYKLNVPPSQLCSQQMVLTDPTYWREGTLRPLDRPHHRPTHEDLIAVKAALDERLKVTQIKSAYDLEGIESIARRLGVSPGTIKRNFPEEHAKLIAQREELRIGLHEIRRQERNARLAAAIAETSESQLPITSRNLKRTGKIKVSDLVISGM
jgi:hypothetical protein